MARTTIDAQDRPALAEPQAVTWSTLGTGGDGYQVVPNGTLELLFRHAGTGGTGNITVSSVAVGEWLDRTGDLTAALTADQHYRILVPAQGFRQGGYILFSVADSEDIEVAIQKNA
jgi:hypothetical protein